MRDHNDPGTLEMPGLGRVGRPPANGVRAMTDAERARAYRARRKQQVAQLGLLAQRKSAELPALPVGRLLAALHGEIAQLERAGGGAIAAKRRVAALVDELARRYGAH